ncbi:MAG TPA: hypothetical protein VMU69_06585 [Bradyrhizobium sp.]|nr:hypothetical protein [Bradyrhizobium sp.]
MPPVIIDLSHRYFNPMGDGKFRIAFIDRTIVEKITEGFIRGSTCIIRHCGRVFVAREVTDALGGQYDLIMSESKLEVVPAFQPS